MRQVFNCGIFILVCFSVEPSFGQDSLKIRRQIIEAKFNLETGSSHVPSSVLNKFIFGGYISSEKIDKAEGRLYSNMRTGVVSSIEFNHYIFNDYPSLKIDSNKSKPRVYFRGLSLQFKDMGGIRFNDDAYRLVMQGNGQYPGKKLNAEVANALRMQWQAVGVSLSVPFTTDMNKGFKSTSLNFGVSLAHLSGFQSLKNFQANVYTDTLGQQLDVNWDGALESVDRKRRTAGFGLLLNGKYFFSKLRTIEKKYKIVTQEKSIRLGVTDLGIFRVNDVRQYYRNERSAGKTVRIENENTRLADVFGGNFFASRRDTVLQKLDLDSQKLNQWQIAPFTLYAQFKFYSGYAVNLNYTFLSGYLPKAEFVYRLMRVAKTLAVAPTVSLGGFDNWNINLKSNWSIFPKYKVIVYGQIDGIESLILPNIQHGFGARLNLNINF